MEGSNLKKRMNLALVRVGKRGETGREVERKEGRKETHPSGQSNVSSGLTGGTSEREMKLPSTYTLAGP